MRALILSDSHSRKLNLNALEYDYIIHAGDHGSSLKQLKEARAIYVRGNCDLSGPNEEIVTINGIRVFITHGHLYNVKMDYMRLIYRAMSLECKICIFGHTHIQEFFIRNGIAFINPGAYKDNNYAEIIANEVIFHNNDKIIKKSLEE